MDILNFNEFTLIESKTGMEPGGIYESQGTKYVVKFMKQYAVIKEYIGSNLANFLLPKRAPEAFLVKDEDKVYLASKFLDTFETLAHYKDNYQNLEFNFNDNIIHREERTTVARFLAHKDEHDGNFGVIKNGNIIEAAIVDFSLSLSSPISNILYSYNFKSEEKLFYTPETIATLQKIVNIGKEPLLTRIEQLFLDIKSVYNNTKSLKIKENEIKRIILDNFKVCEKELYLHDFLQHIYSITPWDKKFSFSPLEFNEYIDDLLLELVSNNDILSFSLLMPYIIHQPNLPHLMKEAFKKSIEEEKVKFSNKMLPYMRAEPKLMQDILAELNREYAAKEALKANKTALDIFYQFVLVIEDVFKLIFDNIAAYIEPASVELVQEDTTPIFTSGLDEV